MDITFDLEDLGTFVVEDDVHNEFERMRIIIRELFSQFLENVVSQLAFVKTKSFKDKTSVVINHNFGTKEVSVSLKIDDDGDQKIMEAGETEIIDENNVALDFGETKVTGEATVFGKINEANITVKS